MPSTMFETKAWTRTGRPAGLALFRPKERGAMRWRVVLAVVVLLLGVASAFAQEAPGAEGERPRPASGVEAVVQGGEGEGLAPEQGAPPPLEMSLEPKAVVLEIARPKRATAADTRSSLQALSFDEDEATIRVDGRTEVLRPGSRLGDDVVKSVSPGRLVLRRPEVVDGESREALVIVTFDEAGAAKTRVFRTHDPSAPKPPRTPEVTEP